jgi:hypothetical protein
MAAPTVTYGGLDLNDGTTYTLVGEPDFGERVKTWDEYRGLDGTAAQANVSEANLIEVTLRLLVKGTSNATLRAAIGAINTKIDAGAQDLVWNDGGGAITYNCVHSPRAHFRPDSAAQCDFWTFLDLVLYRTP